jgi:hypothetical protein
MSAIAFGVWPAGEVGVETAVGKESDMQAAVEDSNQAEDSIRDPDHKKYQNIERRILKELESW